MSDFENLPPEMFNRVLDYLFDPEDCEVSGPSSLRGHRFPASLLRVNKGIHQLARSYLHIELSWVRVNFSLPIMPLINPRQLAVPHVSITHSGWGECRWDTQILEPDLRQSAQDFPIGRATVDIAFARLTEDNVLAAIHRRWPHMPARELPGMSVLVLEKDLKDFLRVVRINDLYENERPQCRLNPDGTIMDSQDIERIKGADGMTYTIQVHSSKDCKTLLDTFRDLHGPLHKCTITGARDQAHASIIIRSVEHDIGADLNPSVGWEPMEHAAWLKCRGDELLKAGNFEGALNIYRAFDDLLEACEINLEHEDFTRKTDNEFFSRLAGPMFINATIASTYAGLIAFQNWIVIPRDFSSELERHFSLVESNGGEGSHQADNNEEDSVPKGTISFETWWSLKCILSLRACIVGDFELRRDALNRLMVPLHDKKAILVDNQPSPLPKGAMRQILDAVKTYRFGMPSQVFDEMEMERETLFRTRFWGEIQRILHTHPRMGPFKWMI